MGLFGLFAKSGINEGVEEFSKTPGAVLIDVRTPQVYAAGHIPGSRNIPLDKIVSVQSAIPDKSTPLFVHCLSGARSAQAVAILKKMNYCNVKNIGGISDYNGKAER